MHLSGVMCRRLVADRVAQNTGSAKLLDIELIPQYKRHFHDEFVCPSSNVLWIKKANQK
jgi:hypothetical protein